VSITIAGANESEYNGTFDIIVDYASATEGKVFTYELTGSPSSPATGTITATGAYTLLASVTSDDKGAEVNQTAGTEMNLQSPILGVDDELVVGFDAIEDATDSQSDEDLRVELLDRIRFPVAQFNDSNIITQAKTRAGVTRVWVEDVTPLLGQVTIYFMRDNDVGDGIPNATQVNDTWLDILEIKPANTSGGTTPANGDVIVASPIAVEQAFDFNGTLVPNTATMQAAVTANLEQFFTEKTEVGENVTELSFNNAIFNSRSPTTGELVEKFTLTTPTPGGPIVVAPGEIATLGAVDY
jgi:uncharacterized phage protein gp47/JayE